MEDSNSNIHKVPRNFPGEGHKAGNQDVAQGVGNQHKDHGKIQGDGEKVGNQAQGEVPREGVHTEYQQQEVDGYKC